MNIAITNSMITHDVIQGSDEWLALRESFDFTGSEVAVIMGVHPNITRDELLEAKCTYTAKEYNRFVVEKVFEKGHETEALARPILEAKLGEDLYPVVGSKGNFLVSYDGLTLLGDAGFEHKQWNAALAALVEAGNPPPYIYWQLEAQFHVNPDQEKCILVVSDGTENNWAEHEYTPVPGRREEMLAACEQFNKDRAEWKFTEKKVQAVGVRPDSLPAISVEVQGQLVTIDNIAEFKKAAQAQIDSIKTELETDQDFADAEVTIKWLTEGEKKIDLIKEQISAKANLETILNALDDVQLNMMRATRLKLNKQVDAQKANRRNQIVSNAQNLVNAYLEEVDEEFSSSGVKITGITHDFYAVIKGKRSFDSMQSAVNDEIARLKIQSTELAGKIRKNLAVLGRHKEHNFLFSNKQQLAYMDTEVLDMTIKTKIRDYKDEQAKSEDARKKKHSDVIASIKLAANFDDSIPLVALESTRERIRAIDPSVLEEYSVAAGQEKKACLKKLTDRIDVLRFEEEKAAESLKQNQAAAAKPPVEVKAAPAPVRQTQAALSSVTATHPLTSEGPFEDGPARPADKEIIETLAEHYGVTAGIIIDWIGEMDLEQAINDLLAHQ